MKIYALDVDGNNKEYDAVMSYYSEEYDKHYMVYTDNEYIDDMLKIYISNYDPNSYEVIVKEIEEEEYSKVKIEIDKILLDIKSEIDKIDEIENAY